jgi:DNA-binding transcriptional regulator PaaX
MARTWVFLVYTLPREPSAPRVALWRKLKHLGALLLHDALWALPGTPPLLEHVRWLVTDIEEAGGEAHVWLAEQGLPGQDDALAQRFLAQSEAEYQTILTALDASNADQKALARRYQHARACDYFHAPSADTVRARLEGGRPCDG